MMIGDERCPLPTHPALAEIASTYEDAGLLVWAVRHSVALDLHD